MRSNSDHMADSYGIRYQASPEEIRRLNAPTREPSPPTVSSLRIRAVIAAAVTVLGICYFFPATIAYFVAAATAFGVYKGVNHLSNRPLSEAPSSASTEPDNAVIGYNPTSGFLVGLNNNKPDLSTTETYSRVQQALHTFGMSGDTDHDNLLDASESYDQEDNNNHASREVGIIVDNAREEESDDAADGLMESRISKTNSLGQ